MRAKMPLAACAAACASAVRPVRRNTTARSRVASPCRSSRACSSARPITSRNAFSARGSWFSTTRTSAWIRSRQRLIQRTLLAIRVGQVVQAVGDARLHTGAMVGCGGDLPRGNGLGVAAAQMADDAQVVRGAAGRGVIAIAARGHQGLRAEVGGFGEVTADEGDRAPRVERMTLDAMLAALPRRGEGLIDPLETLFVPTEPRLRDAVEQGEGGLGELALVARAQELDYRGMVAGGRECAGLCDDGRRLCEALVVGVIFGHWDALSRLEAHRPLQQRFRDLVLAEVRQRVCERLVVERLARAEFFPRCAVVFAIPEAEQLRFDDAVAAVRDAVAVQVAARTPVPDLQVGRLAELQAARLENHADLAGVDADGDEDRVPHSELTDARDELGIGGREEEERMRFGIDAAAVVDLDRARLAAHRPERHLILVETKGRCQGHRSGAARASIKSSCELWSLSPAQGLGSCGSCGSFHRCGLVRAARYRQRQDKDHEGAAHEQLHEDLQGLQGTW